MWIILFWVSASQDIQAISFIFFFLPFSLLSHTLNPSPSLSLSCPLVTSLPSFPVSLCNFDLNFKFLYIKLNLIAHLQKLKIVWKLREVKRLFTLIWADMSWRVMIDGYTFTSGMINVLPLFHVGLGTISCQHKLIGILPYQYTSGSPFIYISLLYRASNITLSSLYFLSLGGWKTILKRTRTFSKLKYYMPYRMFSESFIVMNMFI